MSAAVVVLLGGLVALLCFLRWRRSRRWRRCDCLLSYEKCHDKCSRLRGEGVVLPSPPFDVERTREHIRARMRDA